jgi:hypothetical protein
VSSIQQDPNARLIARASSLNPSPIVFPSTAPVVETTYVRVQAPSEPPQATKAAGSEYRAGGDFFARLRQCESGGNYRTNTGNGYYGAYQYDRATWNNYGGYSTADQAPPEVQDAKARETYARRGGSPWPTCSKRAGG